MAVESPQINSENYSQLLIEKIFKSKKSIEVSIQAATKGVFADHNFITHKQTLTLQAMYANEFRLYLFDPEETVLFEPTPFSNRLLEVTSTTRCLKDSGELPNTKRHLINREGQSESIISNGGLTPTQKPMGIVEFESANNLLGKIQTALDNTLSRRIA